MRDVVSSHIVDESKLVAFIKQHDLQKDQAIVTDVHACSSYALVSGRKGDVATLAFRDVQMLKSGEPELQSGWAVKTDSSLSLRTGANPESRRLFYPLFRLRGPPRPRYWPLR